MKLFKWKFEGCTYNSSDKKSIQEHYGINETNFSQHSRIKLQYAKKCCDIRTSYLTTESNYKAVNSTLIKGLNCDLNKGYALKITAKNRLNKNQKEYILEKFLIGEMNKSNEKETKACEKEMKNLTERFSHAED